MSGFAHPCPDCGCGGEPCLRHSTTFTQGDSSTVTGFTEVSGDWSVSSNVLLTTDNNAIIICDSEAEDGHGIVTATGWANSSNESVLIIGSYVDSNNYLYLKFTFHSTAATGSLWERSGGVDTQLSTADVELDIAPGTAVGFTLCWDGSSAKATASAITGGGLTVNLQWNEAYSGTGTKAGMGHTGGTGSVNFTAFALGRHAVDNAECSECVTLLCTACASGGDDGWQIDLPADFSCAGSHIIDDLKFISTDSLGTVRCVWQNSISGCGGSVEYMWVSWTAHVSPILGVSVFIEVIVMSDGVQIGGYYLDDTDPNWPGDSCASFSFSEVPGSGAGEINSVLATSL